VKTATILTVVSLYNSDEIWYAYADFDSGDSHETKTKFYKSNMADGLHLENPFKAKRNVIRLTPKVKGGSRITCNLGHVTKIENFEYYTLHFKNCYFSRVMLHTDDGTKTRSLSFLLRFVAGENRSWGPLNGGEALKS